MMGGGAMKRVAGYICVGLAVLALAGCAARKKAVDRTEEKPAGSHRELIERIERRAFPGDSLEKRLSMTVGGKSIGGTMRLVSGQKLWINISVLGITFARAMFTQDSLMYYEKVKKTAFDGRWEELHRLSPLLGAVNYDVLEGLVCARPVFALTQDSFLGESEEGKYLFSRFDAQSGLMRYVLVDKKTLAVSAQRLASPDGKWALSAEYAYGGDGTFPQSVLLSLSGESGMAVRLSFAPSRRLQPDFPFRIPEGYSDARESLRALGVEI